MSGKKDKKAPARPTSLEKWREIAWRIGREEVMKKRRETTRLTKMGRGVGVVADPRSEDGIKEKWHDVSFFDLKEKPKKKAHQRQVSKLVADPGLKAAAESVATTTTPSKKPAPSSPSPSYPTAIGVIDIIAEFRGENPLFASTEAPKKMSESTAPTDTGADEVFVPGEQQQPQADTDYQAHRRMISADDSYRKGKWEDEEQDRDLEKGDGEDTKGDGVDQVRDEIDGSKIELDEDGKPVLTHFPWFIVLASLAQIAMIVWEVFEQHWFLPISQNMWYGPSSQVLIDMGAKYVPQIKNGQSYRWFLAVWLHAGLIHLALNLSMQLSVGLRLERAFGWYRIGPIYILSGVFGNIVSSIFLPGTLTVGASGAIFGLEAVLIAEVLQLWSRLKRPFVSLLQVLFSCVVLLASGIAPKTDNFAHVGGFLMGFFSALMLLPTMVFGKWHVARRVLFFSLGLIICLVLFGVALAVFFLSVDAYKWCGWCEYVNCVPITPNWCSQSSS